MAERISEEEKSLQEINHYKDAMFPVGIYIVTKEWMIPEGRGYMDLHWHEELQFTWVVSGTIHIQINGIEYSLETGEAVFINRNALHVTNYMTEDAKYISLNLPEKMLGLFPHSRMEQDQVLPFTRDYLFSAMVFRPDSEWKNQILGNLQLIGEIFRKTEKREKFWEYEVSRKILDCWYLMITHRNLEENFEGNVKILARKQERMQQMLTYMHTNYMHKIRVSDIAAAGCVSEGECNRCFQEMVMESPTRYLLRYRYMRARELLQDTDLSVTEVALGVGFNDISYFIQYFRKQSGMTPKQFRALCHEEE